MSTVTGAVEAAEALVRWRSSSTDDLGVMVAAADRGPVIRDLDTWVASCALRDAAAWQRGSLPDVRVHVNLSARGLWRRGFGDRWQAQVAEAGVDVTRVTLEITETSALPDPEVTARRLARLREGGLQVWLDDFGTGHSSLEWLWKLPVDGVKIPGTFVEDVTRDRQAATITGAVIALAHRLGLRVVAEGVETEEQRRWLADAGCDALQGFLFHAALPADELPLRLAAR